MLHRQKGDNNYNKTGEQMELFRLDKEMPLNVF